MTLESRPLDHRHGGTERRGQVDGRLAIFFPPKIPFVNADEVAKGLAGLSVAQASDIDAARIVLETMDELRGPAR